MSPSGLELRLGPRSLDFTGQPKSAKTTYRLELEFFAEINDKECKMHHTARNIRLKLAKAALDRVVLASPPERFQEGPFLEGRLRRVG